MIEQLSGCCSNAILARTQIQTTKVKVTQEFVVETTKLVSVIKDWKLDQPSGTIYRTFLHLRGIPPEIENLSKLVRFDAANCRLTSEIPLELRKLQNLDTLFLQVNGLSRWYRCL
ncbi:hypothetical protein K1719_007077 [Acacia pycnantha]|nr:hypothetical protein K1719_007077 [Acacia pycnantha]